MWSIVANRNLRTLLEQKALEFPQKIFFIFEDSEGITERITYQQLDHNVNKVANFLTRMGIGKGDKIHLHLRNCPEFLYFWFGLAKIGAIMVPTNYLSTAHELQYILSHSESLITVTEPQYLEVVKQAAQDSPKTKDIIVCRSGERQEGVLLVEDILKEGATSPPSASHLLPDDVVAIMYTSGTTARPKGVVLTHAYYIWTGELAAHHEKLRTEDRHFVVLPLFHGNAQFYSVMASLITGASIAATQTFSASRYFEQAKRHKVTVGSLFAAPMRMILSKTSPTPPKQTKMRLILFAQNLTREQLVEFEQRTGACLAQIYGLTELSFPMCNPIDGYRDNMSIGRPTLGVGIRVVDSHGENVPIGQTGELIIKGIPGWTLMKEYFKEPQATLEAIRGGWFYTGDNVKMMESGFVYFVDRKKDMIISGGLNVYSRNVEDTLCEHPKVVQAAVIGLPDPKWGERVTGVVVLQNGAKVTPAEIIGFCKRLLTDYKCPKQIEIIEEIPLTPVGKIDKKQLRTKFS